VYPFAETVGLGTAASRVDRKLRQDAENMQIVNAPEATDQIRRKYRKNWELQHFGRPPDNPCFSWPNRLVMTPTRFFCCYFFDRTARQDLTVEKTAFFAPLRGFLTNLSRNGHSGRLSC
jgi:hypothetical protein